LALATVPGRTGYASTRGVAPLDAKRTRAANTGRPLGDGSTALEGRVDDTSN
jgi:hypothetical protein